MEILVVVGITVLLSTLAIGYSRSNDRQFVVFREHSKIVGLLNRSKAFAIEKFDERPHVDAHLCAFGLHFEPDSNDYVFFQDVGKGGCGATNFAYDSDGVTMANGTVVSEDISRHSLDSRLVFEGIPAGGLDIVFKPPELDPRSNADFPVQITIKTVAGDFVATTSISAAGQISTQ